MILIHKHELDRSVIKATCLLDLTLRNQKTNRLKTNNLRMFTCSSGSPNSMTTNISNMFSQRTKTGICNQCRFMLQTHLYMSLCNAMMSWSCNLIKSSFKVPHQLDR